MCTFIDNGCNFNSNIVAIINGKEQYANLYEYNATDTILCKNGHQLKFSNGLKKIPYFSHKNSKDLHGSDMSDWHKNWQSKFETTEIKYTKLETQIKTRYADVVLSNHYTIEFQNSKISRIEIESRKHDYNLHDTEIIWVINGSSDVKLKQSLYGEYLSFGVSWKYDSFLLYEFVYIHINNRVCVFMPKHVGQSKMVSTKSFSEQEWIHNMNTEIFYDTPLPKFNLTIKQQGAGNGKTYGLNKMLFEESVEHYSNIIIITKQHSAKTTIKETFLEVKMNLLNDGDLDDESYVQYDEECSLNGQKYYQISAEINDKHKLITIATIDSLCYRLGDHTNDSKSLNVISNWVKSINPEHLVQTSNSNSIKYGGNSVSFDKETLLILDESQDLEPIYAKALLAISTIYNCDLYVVGDLLQSISYEDNAFSYFQTLDDPNINILDQDPSNVCRRFKDSYLRDFVNSVVPFAKFDLPSIKLNEVCTNDKDNLSFIEVPSSQFELDKWASTILKTYAYEVEHNNRSREDFLIIFPIVSSISAPNYLNVKINEYWSNRYKLQSSRYSIFHKGQEGSSINLEESKEATRIVSIHSSKGDGRSIVFVCGLSEITLMCFDCTKGLKYESLLHVALTRQKNKLYVVYTNDMINDDIGCRFRGYLTNTKASKIYIDNSIRYNTIISAITNENNFRDIQLSIIDHTEYQCSEEETTNTKIIDMGHHHIRYGTMFMTFIIDVLTHSDVSFPTIKDSLKDLKDKKWHPTKQQTNLRKFESIRAKGDKGYLVHYRKGGECAIISDSIYQTMINVHTKVIPNILDSSITQICVYEALIFYYMYNMFTSNGKKWKSPISITDLYTITETYYATFNNTMDGHTNCQCKMLFGLTDKNTRMESIYRISQRQLTKEIINDEHVFLHKHYDSIHKIRIAYRSIITQNADIQWMPFRQFKHKYEKNNLILNLFELDINQCNIAFVGENNTELIMVYMKPTYNTLNYNEHLLTSIYHEHAFNKYLDIKKRMRHVVFTSNANNKFEYQYDNSLLFNANKLIDSHFSSEFKKHAVRLIPKLSSIYYETYHYKNYKRFSIKQYQYYSSRFISSESAKECHSELISNKHFKDLYDSISIELTPDLFKFKLANIIDTIEEPECLSCTT